ncbi:MAG: universal stress protein [Candidatus Binatia bacterium]
MFKHILVPVDLSAKNTRALAVARELAEREHARVTLLHVIQRVEHIPLTEMQAFYRRIGKHAERKVRLAAARFARQGVKVLHAVLIGTPAAEIVRHAEMNKVDLIVMKSHEVTNLARPGQGLGTTSYKVAILCRCPVLLVK